MYIRCTLKVTVVTCCLAALLVAGAACGGGASDNGGSDKTFRGGGLSFNYPAEWRVRTAGPVDDNVARYQVKVAPPGRANDVIAVTVGTVGVVIEGKDLAITEENIDENKELAVVGAETMVAMGGGKLSEPTRVTFGGLPGFRAEASNVKVQGGGRVASHYTSLFKGPTTYTVSCVYTPDGAAEIKRGCDQVLASFRVGDGGKEASGRDPGRNIQATAQERAESIVLKLSDFPDGWRTISSGYAAGRKEFNDCIGADYSPLTLIGFAESQGFTDDTTDAASETSVFESEGQAEDAIKAFSKGMESGAFDDCARKAVEEEDLGGGKIELGEIEVGGVSLTPPDVEEASAWRITIPATVTDRKGVKSSGTNYSDIVHLREGDTVATLEATYQAPGTFDPELCDKLLQVLADRMAGARGRR